MLREMLVDSPTVICVVGLGLSARGYLTTYLSDLLPCVAWHIMSYTDIWFKYDLRCKLDITPSSSRTTLGPRGFRSALHCPITRNLLPKLSLAAPAAASVNVAGKPREYAPPGTHHDPRRSTPPSPALPTRRSAMCICEFRYRKEWFSYARPISAAERRDAFAIRVRVMLMPSGQPKYAMSAKQIGRGRGVEETK